MTNALRLLLFADCICLALTAKEQPPMPNDLSISPNSRHGNRTNVKLLAFVNYGGEILPLGQLCTEGMLLALNTSISYAISSLRASKAAKRFHEMYSLSIELTDDQCSQAYGIQAAVGRLLDSTKMANVVPFVLTSPCAVGVRIGQLLHHLNFAGLTMTSTSDAVFFDRRMYASFYPILNSNAMPFFARPICRFATYNGWSKVAILSETNQKWSTFENAMTSEMELANLTLLGIVKVPFESGSTSDAIPVKAAISELTFLDPRVIVIVSNVPSLVACWLHRNGMYGPFYVYLFPTGTLFVPDKSPRYSWCSAKMISEVMASIVFFGNGPYMSYNTKTAMDSFGMTGLEFDNELKRRIGDEVTTSPYWPLLRTLCYDQVLIAVQVLQEAEETLRQTNGSLSDWLINAGQTLSSDGFRRVVNESLLKVNFRGLMSRISFTVDPSTHDAVSYKHDVASFYQCSPSTASEAIRPVASFNFTTATLQVGPTRIYWRTQNGLAPPDSLRIILLQEPAIPPIATWLLTTISWLLLICEATVIIVMALVLQGKCQRFEITGCEPRIKIVVLVGNAFMNIYNLLLPLMHHLQIGETGCAISTWFLAVGCTLTLISLHALLEIGIFLVMLKRKRRFLKVWMCRVAGNTAFTAAWWQCVEETALSHVIAKKRLASKLAICYVAVTSVLSTIFATAILTSPDPPLQSATFKSEMLKRESEDFSTAYQPYVVRCQLVARGLTASVVLTLIWTVLHCLVAIRLAFLAFYLFKKTVSFVPDLGRICMITIFQMSTVISIEVAVNLTFRNSYYGGLAMSLSIVIVIISLFNVIGFGLGIRKAPHLSAPIDYEMWERY